MQDKFGYTALHYAFLPSMSDEEAENLPHYNRSMLVNGKDAWVKKVKQIRAKLPSLDVDAENFYRLLLGVAGLNLNVTSSSGETALLLSCKSICPDKEASGLAGRLLQAGADPNIAVSLNVKFFYVLRALTQAVQDDQGTTPLQLAAYSQKQLLAKLLLMYNADADLADRKGVNGLIAGVIGYLKVTEELTEQKKRADQYNSGAVEESANTIESRTEKAVATFQVLLDAILPVVKDINKADEVSTTWFASALNISNRRLAGFGQNSASLPVRVHISLGAHQNTGAKVRREHGDPRCCRRDTHSRHVEKIKLAKFEDFNRFGL